MRLLIMIATILLLYNKISTQDPIAKTSVLPELRSALPADPAIDKIRLDKPEKRSLGGNHRLTGGLMLRAGAAKGFNETLQFNWKGFSAVFPGVNAQWF